MKRLVPLLVFLLQLASAPGRAASLASLVAVSIEGDGGTLTAERGLLRVPERRGVESARTIRVAFLRLASTAEKPGPPIFFLADGPEHSGIDVVQSHTALFSWARQFGDVVAIDVRGAGGSRPGLHCAQEVGWPLDRVLTRRAALDQLVRSSRKCARAWTRRRFDVGAFGLQEMVADVDDLRGALGAPRVILWGVGEGTRVALRLLERHGESVEAAILHGPVDPRDRLDPSEAVSEIFAGLTRRARLDPRVGSPVPDLELSLRRLVARLEAAPAHRLCVDPETGEEVPVTFAGWELGWRLLRAMEEKRFLETLPALLMGLERDDEASWRLVTELVARGRRGHLLDPVVSWTTTCQPGWNALPRGTNRGLEAGFPFPEICSAWPSPGPVESLDPEVDVETRILLLSASHDVRTPPSAASSLMERLPNGFHFTLEGGAHEDLMRDTVALRGALGAFLAGGRPPLERVDTGLTFDPAPAGPPAARSPGESPGGSDTSRPAGSRTR